MIARAALAAGFGLDFERCAPEVFAAVMEELDERDRRQRHEERMRRLRR